MTTSSSGDSTPRPSGEHLRRALSDVASDPSAPPSTVTATSVIAAARSTVERPDELAARRARRTRVLAVLVAASLAGLAAVVIPLALRSTTSTTASTTASNAGSVSAGSDSAGSAGEAFPAPASAAAAGAAGLATSSAAAGGPALDPSRVADQAGRSADVREPSSAAGTDGAGTDAAGALVPSEMAAEAGPAAEDPGQAGQSATAALCWLALPEPVVAAVVAALPPGQFGAPGPLTLACPPTAVAGAELPGVRPGTGLVIRISTAAPAACLSAAADGTWSGAATGSCVARPDGTFVAPSDANPQTVYGYDGTVEVAVGSVDSVGSVGSVGSGPPGAGATGAGPAGISPTGGGTAQGGVDAGVETTGLTASELVAVVQATLRSLR